MSALLLDHLPQRIGIIKEFTLAKGTSEVRVERETGRGLRELPFPLALSALSLLKVRFPKAASVRTFTALAWLLLEMPSLSCD